ncbi:MAG: preprotein translocase subunit SecA [Candidatus Spechtbacteria bacterium RIFCSPHIGHO2_01_FULL_43_30]|uniref:Protein translocase subunit SecA n=1 Tax=Candidatus Spechtbacteria bacterium RIFCSPHIGHO2_01_FULL_43_30 TaxID=1802158 RepID=A0A1G2H4B1_9BACT|nr:MAG: preprotein translocase subunit SecA [Candidatus Spechtbacteria bacterium RIFCSPHIGHO2_01_FULL_43_30]
MSLFSKILGDPNEKEIKKLNGVVDRINAFELEIATFSDAELRQKSSELANELRPPKLTGSDPASFAQKLDEILPIAFALVREAAKRTLGQRHYDVQLMGGVVLHQGKIAEMRTGEGKTLAATTSVCLNALTGKGVHVVTVNDYLAKRDAVWMGQIYNILGLSIGCIVHDSAFIYDAAYKVRNSQFPIINGESNINGAGLNEVSADKQNSKRDEARDTLGAFKVEDSYLRPCTRKEAYDADITYGTNNEFGFDYLRDNLAHSLDQMVQRSHYFAIVDEVDSILIDEARTPLIISAPDAESTSLYKTFSQIVPQLKEGEDYNVDEKMRAATITENGISKLEKILGIENIYDPAKGGGIRYAHQLEQALRAHTLFRKDKDYVVKNGEVIIVDEFTGRLMPGRRYSEGLHQALEAKENVEVQKESRTLASITFQNYFRMYEKLAGMTGTAMTSAEEFDRVYKIEIVSIPTNKPMIRKDSPDFVFRSRAGKMRAMVEEVKKRHEKGQPILIGTTSIQNNEVVSTFLQKAGIKHEVLNAKNHEREGEIIAQAGRKDAVTVATNMAGRGVDIILGGNPPSTEEAKKVCEAGGLFVLGTERHEARRIDNQLRGRAGRQGDPGESQFFVSLDDDLMRVFGGDRIKRLMETLRIPEDQPIASGMISGAIESAQGKIEGFHFDTRKHVLEYDEVLNKQRQTIYGRRINILKPDYDTKREILNLLEEEIQAVVNFHTGAGHPAEWNIEEIYENIKSIFPLPSDFHQQLFGAIQKKEDADDLKTNLMAIIFGKAKQVYGEKEEKSGEKAMRELEKFVLIRTIDILWMDHLDAMEYLRDSVRLRAYGQKDPLVEYKREGREMFVRLLDTIRSQVVNTIFKVELRQSSKQSDAGVTESSPENDVSAGNLLENDSASVKVPQGTNRVGRNDPCWCGSGKKYKKCHGKLG